MGLGKHISVGAYGLVKDACCSFAPHTIKVRHQLLLNYYISYLPSNQNPNVLFLRQNKLKTVLQFGGAASTLWVDNITINHIIYPNIVSSDGHVFATLHLLSCGPPPDVHIEWDPSK